MLRVLALIGAAETLIIKQLGNLVDAADDGIDEVLRDAPELPQGDLGGPPGEPAGNLDNFPEVAGNFVPEKPEVQEITF